MASNVLRAVDGQAELALSRPATALDVPLEMIRCQRSAAAAIQLACSSSGLEDKEIYLPMQIDAGQWSRIKAGTANFPVERIAEFCKLVGNTVLVEWQAYQVGCTLVMLKSEAERRAELEKARADEAEKKLAWAMELLQGRKAA